MEINESLFKEKCRVDLLHRLIEKYEQSRSYVTGTPGKQRPQIALRKSPFSEDYNDEMDFRKRQ
ncbi:MAG: hypothetical protein ACYCVB_08965 [Bacilli bacterium]